nr:MAG: putative RNA dependent RNA polymerase [Enontekio reovirus]
MSEKISSMIIGRFPLEESELSTLDYGPIILSFIPDVILDVLHAIRPQIVMSGVNFSVKYNSPPNYVLGSMTFREEYEEKFVQADVKYLGFYDAYELVTRYERSYSSQIHKKRTKSVRRATTEQQHEAKVISLGVPTFLTITADTNFAREMHIMTQMLRRCSSQGRGPTIPRLIGFVLSTVNGFIDRGFNIFNHPIVVALVLIYEKYTRFPYIEIGDKMEFRDSCPATLPMLTYSLVQLYIHWILGNVSNVELTVAVNCRLEFSLGQYDDLVLKFKETRISCIKLLLEATKVVLPVQYTSGYPSGYYSHEEPNEIWVENNAFDERANISIGFIQNAPSALYKYLTEDIGVFRREANKLYSNRVLEDDYAVRKLYNFIQIAGNHLLFIKNPVLLTLDKSVLSRRPHTHGGVGKIDYANVGGLEVPFKIEFEDIFGEIWRELSPLIEQYNERICEMNLDERFINLLTNNASGYKLSDADTLEFGIVGKLASQKRLFQFIIKPQVLTNYSDYMANVSIVADSGERKQVDRRGRIIQAVANAAQLVPMISFVLADMMANDFDEFSCKKGTGRIKDMLGLLINTGLQHTISESGDISGFDASANESVRTVMRYLIQQILKGSKDQPYMWAKPTDLIVLDQSGRNRIIERISGARRLSLVAPLLTSGSMFRLTDEYGYGNIVLTDRSFPSGQLDTNAHHSIFLTMAVRVARSRFVDSNPDSRVSDFRTFVSGDDIWVGVKHDKDEGGVKKFFQTLSDVLVLCGFKYETMLSKYYAIFLQQTAICGKPLPLCSRLCIVCSEKSEGRRKDRVSQFDEIIDIVRELAGRSVLPSSWPAIIRGLFHTSRNVKFRRNDALVASRKLFAKFPYDWFLCIGTEINTLIPFFFLFIMDGFGLPFPRVRVIDPETSELVTYEGSRSTQPRGHICEMLLRRAFRKLSLTKVTDVDLLNCKMKLINQSLNDRYLGIQDVRLGDVPQHAEYLSLDHDQLKRFRLPLAQVFGRNRLQLILNEVRISRVDPSITEKLVYNLDIYMDHNKKFKSLMAHNLLTGLGISRFPREIIFHLSGYERVKQGYTTIAQKGDYDQACTRLLSILLESNGQYLPVENDGITAMLFELIPIIEREDDMKYVHEHRMAEAAFDHLTGYNICSRDDTEYIDTRWRNGFNHDEDFIALVGYYAYRTGLWKNFKTDSFIRFASKCYRRFSPSVLPLVYDLAGIDFERNRQLKTIIENGELELSGRWSSIFHTRQMFSITTSPRKMDHVCINPWKNSTRIAKRVSMTIDVILRDLNLSLRNLGQVRIRPVLTFEFLQAIYRRNYYDLGTIDKQPSSFGDPMTR